MTPKKTISRPKNILLYSNTQFETLLHLQISSQFSTTYATVDKSIDQNYIYIVVWTQKKTIYIVAQKPKVNSFGS